MIAISGHPHKARQSGLALVLAARHQDSWAGGYGLKDACKLAWKRLCETDVNVVWRSGSLSHRCAAVDREFTHVRNERNKTNGEVRPNSAKSGACATNIPCRWGRRHAGSRPRGFNADTGPCCCVAQDTRRQHQQSEWVDCLETVVVVCGAVRTGACAVNYQLTCLCSA